MEDNQFHEMMADAYKQQSEVKPAKSAAQRMADAFGPDATKFYNRNVFTVRTSDQLSAALRAKAASEGLPINALLNQILSRFLQQNDA